VNISEAYEIYFKKQVDVYMRLLNTLPSVPWDENTEHNLFVTGPDEDYEAQWKPQRAKMLNMSILNQELNEFFGSFYYLELNGEYQKVDFYFPPITSETDASKKASIAIEEGDYYFQGQNTVLLASCSKSGNDDYLLFYKQYSSELFLFDTDKEIVFPLDFTLTTLLSSLEPEV
jgi:hypothetical protein